MKTKLILVLFSSLILHPSAFPQGSLTPPGAPAPTMKTLDQVEPRTRIPGGTSGFTISSAGSYYLSGNLSLGSGLSITVSADNVTIDLQGFEVAGTGGGTGIFLSGGVSNVTIRNGTVRNFTNIAINGIGNSKVRVENVRALNNGSVGINVDVNGAVIDCVAEGNAGAGIVGADNCVIRNCQSIGNTVAGSHGISLGASAQISGCVARNNTGSGIVTGTGGTLSDCVASNNTSGGIIAAARCTIQSSSAHQNGINGGTTANSPGIRADFSCTITNCSGNGNTGDGLASGVIQPPLGASVHNSTFNGNTLTGISAPDGSIIVGCTANENQGAGIYANGSSTVANCTATANTGDGINLVGNSLASGNTCYFNGFSGTGAGIHITGFGRNRIENNNVTGNDFGIKVDVGGNLITKNSASGNGTTPATDNYSLTGTNTVGAIVTATGTITADPWANFSY